MSRVLLFDIDGTLIQSGGAGLRGMTRAFAELFRIDNAFEGLTLAGMTDELIFRNACAQTWLRFSDAAHEAFKERYFRTLGEEIQAPGPAKRVLPGVIPLLENLQQRNDVNLGLLTGNYAISAEIKLAHFDLFKYFEFGAFGDDSRDRDALLPYAIARYRQKASPSDGECDVWIIGDTPKDIQCARPHGASALAVATGDYSAEVLRANHPDALLPNLENQDAFLKIIYNSGEK